MKNGLLNSVWQGLKTAMNTIFAKNTSSDTDLRTDIKTSLNKGIGARVDAGLGLGSLSVENVKTRPGYDSVTTRLRLVASLLLLFAVGIGNVWGATSITVYTYGAYFTTSGGWDYANSSMKVSVRLGYNDWIDNATMTKTDYTYLGFPIYSYTFTEKNGGAEIYFKNFVSGAERESYHAMSGDWMGTSDLNGKMYLGYSAGKHNWVTYATNMYPIYLDLNQFSDGANNWTTSSAVFDMQVDSEDAVGGVWIKDKLYAFSCTKASPSKLKFMRLSNDRSSTWNTAADITYSSSYNTYKITGWNAGVCANDNINLVNKTTRVYYDKSQLAIDKNGNSNLTYIYFVIGRDNFGSYSKSYNATQVISNTKLIYYELSSDVWRDATYYGFIGSGSSYGDGSWGSSNLSSATKYTAAYKSQFDLKEGQINLFVPASSSNGATITPTYIGTAASDMNNTQTVAYALSTDGGTTFNTMTSGTVPGKLEISAYKFVDDTYNSVSNSKNKQTIAASSTGTYSASVPAAYTGETVLDKTTSSGYEWIGWYDALNSGSEVTSPYYPTGDKTIYARYKTKTWSITYKDNGNVTFSGAHVPEKVENHTYLAETSLNKACKSGYVFDGWYKESDCSGTVKTSIGATEFTSAPTLYAKWTAMSLTALANNTLYKAEDMVVDGITTIPADSRLIRAGVSANNKFNLLGNTSDSQSNTSAAMGVQDVTSGSADATIDRTDFAYTLWFNGTANPSGISGSTLPTSRAIQFVVPATGTLDIYCNNPSHIYLLKSDGSAVAIAASGTSTAKTIVDVTAGTYYLYANGGSNVKLYGLRFRNTYTVTAAVNNGSRGSASAGDAKLHEGETTTITASPNAGYKVTNWAVSGTGASISPNGASESLTTTLTMGTANATVTATLTPITYSITYNLDGGTNYVGAPTSYNIETATIVLGTPTKDHYHFDGWTDDNNSGAPITSIPVGSTGNVSITAHWTRLPMVYLKNTMNWDNAYVTFYSGNYWDIQHNPSHGTGSLRTSEFYVADPAAMTYNSTTGLFEYECPDVYTYTYASFTKMQQNNYGNFADNNEVIYVNNTMEYGKVVIVDAATSTIRNGNVKYYESNVNLVTLASGEGTGWFIPGGWTDWETRNAEFSWNTSPNVQWTKTLTHGDDVEFKVYNHGEYYGFTSGLVKGTETNRQFVAGQNNCKLRIGAEGTYTFDYNTSTNKLSVTYPAVYAVAGGFNDWSESANTMSGTDTRTASITLTPGEQILKIISNGSYYGYDDEHFTGTATRTLGIDEGNITVDADVYPSGSYSLSYVVATKALTVTFPSAYTVTYDVGTVKGQSAAPTMAPSAGGSNIPSGSKVASGTSVTFTAAAAATDYRFLGWYDAAEGGNLLSASTTYTTTINAATTVYAQYAKLVITWQNNMLSEVHATSNPSGGVVNALPATDPTSCSTLYPIFCGWSATEPDGSYWGAAPSYISTSTPVTADVTYYAVFKDATRNRWYTQCPPFKTFTFSAGTGTGDDYLAYTENTTYEMPNATTTGMSKDGYTLSGWTTTVDVTLSGGGSVSAGDVISVGSTVSGISGDMTFTAVWTGNIAITGDIWLTSYNGVTVYSTSTTNNLITVSSADATGATRYKIIYLDGNGDVVVKGSSLFRLCNNGSANYNMVDASSDYVSVSSGAYSQTYSISYTPGAYNTIHTGYLKLQLLNGSTLLSEATLELHGRSLPEEFVIATKDNDNIWYALPNTIVDNTHAVTPTRITVDNETTPTAATYAPTTTVYKGAGRYNTSNAYGIRFTDGVLKNSEYNHLQISSSTSTHYPWLSYTGSNTNQDWWLKSSDFSSYELNVPTSGATNAYKLGISGGNIGYFNTVRSGPIYLLPITNKYTDIPATVTEWGQHSVILAANPGATANKAKAHVGSGTPTADQTLIGINGAIGTAKNVKVPVGDIDLADLTNNEGKLLYIDWYNEGGTSLGTSCITIPRIIAESRNMKTDGEKYKNAWTDKEVHVLPGATLTANTASYSPSGAAIKELHIYPGATLNVTTGTLTATTLRLHNGWTRAGDKQYNTARVYIADDAALVKTTASIDYDIYEQSDGKHYYPFAVPFETDVSTIDYVDSYLAGFSTYGTHYGIDEYDGAERAKSGPSNGNWKQVAESATLQPSKGYTITAVAVKGEAIIRVPLTFDNGWTSDGEKASNGGDPKNVIAVTAHTGAATEGGGANLRHAGWNMLGVPFMSCYTTGTDMASGETTEFIKGKMVVIGGSDPYGGYDDNVVYVSVPTHDFAEYLQTDITETKLVPGWSFFVQIGKSGNLNFLTTKQAENSNTPLYAPQYEDTKDVVMRTGIVLSGAEASDKTTILVSNRYSTDYEIGADLEKMFGNGYTLATYSINNGTQLAFNAMSRSDMQQVIPIGYRAPSDGEYTFSINPRYASEEFERIDLIDYEMGTLTNLLTSDYQFVSGRTQNDTRFALNLVQRPQTPTDLDDIRGESEVAEKVMIEGMLFIIRGGVMYDATGKKVK